MRKDVKCGEMSLHFFYEIAIFEDSDKLVLSKPLRRTHSLRGFLSSEPERVRVNLYIVDGWAFQTIPINLVGNRPDTSQLFSIAEQNPCIKGSF